MKYLYSTILTFALSFCYGQQIPLYYLKADTTDGIIVMVKNNELVLVNQDSLSAVNPLDEISTVATFQINGNNLEIATTSINGGTTTVSTVDISRFDKDSSSTNELQGLTLLGTELTITDSNSVDLSGLNTDDQNLSFDPKSGTDVKLNIQDGIDVTFREGANMTLTRSGSNLLILEASGDGTGTDDQDLTLVGNTLAIESDPNTDVDLSGYLDNTDAQTLSFGTGTGDLTISGGNTTNLDGRYLQTEVDGSITNEGFLDVGIGGGNSSTILSNTLGSPALEIAGGANVTVTESGDVITIAASSGSDGVATSGTHDQINRELDVTVTGASDFSIDISALPTKANELTDVVSPLAYTTRHVLIGNGANLEERALTEADISDLGTYLTSEVDGSVTNEGSLTVGAGTATTALINSNTTASTPVTIEAGAGITLAEAGNTITITGESGTDDQVIDTFELSGTTLRLSIEGDGQPFQTTDLSSLQDGTGTDDQNLSFDPKSGTDVSLNIQDGLDVSFREGANITLTRSASNLMEISATGDGTGTDDQNLDVGSFNLSNGELTIGIENGTDQVVDLDGRYLTGEVDGSVTNELQDIDVAQLVGTDFQLSLTQDATVHTVDLSSLSGGSADGVVTSGSHDQINEELDFVVASPGSNFSVDISALPTNLNGLTDVVSPLGYANRNVLISNGTNYTGRALTEADISDLQSYLTTEVDGSVTNELQNLSMSATQLQISSGTNVNLSTFADNFANEVEATQTQAFVFMDSIMQATGDLTYTTTTDGMGDWGIEIGYNDPDKDAANELQDFDVANLNGTNLELSLTQEVTTHTVNLSSLQDGTGTDDQVIDTFELSGTTLRLSIEGDGQPFQTTDLSSLQDGTGTDDQNLSFDPKSGTDVKLNIQDGIDVTFREGNNITLNRLGSNLLEIEASGGGGGDVYKAGTPLNNQVPVWVNDSTIEGDADFTFNGSDLTVGGTLGLNGRASSPGLAITANGNAAFYSGGDFAFFRSDGQIMLSKSGNRAEFVNGGVSMSHRWKGSNIIQYDASLIRLYQDVIGVERATFNNGFTAPSTAYGLQAYADANDNNEYSFGAFPDSGPVSFAVTGNGRVKGTWSDEHNSVTNHGLVPRTYLMPGFEADPHENNMFYKANERFTVTGSNFTNTNYQNFFDNRYPIGGTDILTDSTAVINIEFQNQGGLPASGLTYPQGYIYVVTYQNHELGAASGRMRATDNVWTNLIWEGELMGPVDNWAGDEPMVSHLYRFKVPSSDNYIVEFELTLPNDVAYNCRVVSIEYYPTRPEGIQTPFVSKYTDQRMPVAMGFYDDDGDEQVKIDPNTPDVFVSEGSVRFNGRVKDHNGVNPSSHQTLYGSSTAIGRVEVGDIEDAFSWVRVRNNTAVFNNLNPASGATDITDLGTLDNSNGRQSFTFSSSNFTAPTTGSYKVSATLTLASTGACEIYIQPYVNGVAKGTPVFVEFDGAENETVTINDIVEMTGAQTLDIRSGRISGTATVNIGGTNYAHMIVEMKKRG
jgi:outer membrane lipoprotein-sorting protein